MPPSGPLKVNIECRRRYKEQEAPFDQHPDSTNQTKYNRLPSQTKILCLQQEMNRLADHSHQCKIDKRSTRKPGHDGKQARQQRRPKTCAGASDALPDAKNRPEHQAKKEKVRESRRIFGAPRDG